MFQRLAQQIEDLATRSTGNPGTGPEPEFTNAQLTKMVIAQQEILVNQTTTLEMLIKIVADTIPGGKRIVAAHLDKGGM